MMFSITRVIGNELPPRDIEGNRLKSLQFLLSAEPDLPNCEKIWILNQIHDQRLYQDLIKMIPSNHKIVTVSFDKSKFLRCKTFDEKVICAININGARNIGIESSIRHRFICLFDGDCFFTPSLWDALCQDIIEDQKICNRQCYGVPAIRLLDRRIPENIMMEPTVEPMIILRNDTDLRFDENLPFAKNDRIDLLKKMGYESKAGKTYLVRDVAKDVGRVLHVSFNESRSETDMIYRMNLRDDSMKKLITKIESNLFM